MLNPKLDTVGDNEREEDGLGEKQVVPDEEVVEIIVGILGGKVLVNIVEVVAVVEVVTLID